MYIPDGYAQCNLIWTGSYVPLGAQCAFGMELTVGGQTALSVAQQIATNYTDNIAENLTNAVVLTTVRVKFGPVETGQMVEHGVNIPGTQGGNPTSPNVTFLVHKNTASGGRRGRGRMYLPGVDEAAVDGSGILTGARTTALDADLALFLTTLENDDQPMVLLHSLLPDGSPPPVAPYTVTSLSTDAKVATQRRRQRR